MKNARLDIKVTSAAKAILEQAANVSGTTLSAFILNCAIPKANEIISQAESIYLSREESEQFYAALENSPQANHKLKQLFKKHTPHH